MTVLVILSTLVVVTLGHSMGSYGGFETVYDSQRDGLNHPYVLYDSRRDGGNSPSGKQFAYQNDPNFHVVYDSKRDGVNHPYVLYDSRRDGGSSRSVQMPTYPRQVEQPQAYRPQRQMMTNTNNRMGMSKPQEAGQRGSDPVVYDSKRDGLNHPFVIYDSKRDGPNSPLRNMYANDPNLKTIFDTKVHGWNHPWVLYDSRRDGAPNNY